MIAQHQFSIWTAFVRVSLLLSYLYWLYGLALEIIFSPLSIHHSDLEASIIQSGNSSVICSPGVKNGCFIGRSSSFGIENLVLLRIPSVTHLGRGRP